MSWNCEELSELSSRYQTEKHKCIGKGQNPLILACGSGQNRNQVQCFSKTDRNDQARYRTMLVSPELEEGDAPPSPRSFNPTLSPRLTETKPSPVFNITSPFAFQSSPSFFSPSRRFDVNLARRSLFDELRNYQPRQYVPDNIDIFNAVKGDLLDNVYSYVHRPRINLNPRDRAGNTPLITALLDNNNKASALLIIKGANVNTSNNAGLTPLMAAASNNNELMVDILLKKGANRSARTINGMTASDFTTDPDIKLLIQETKRRKSSKRRSKSRSRSKKKPCRADQVRDRSTGRCRKRKR